MRAHLPAVAVNACTNALFLALQSLDLKMGDEVITTPNTFVATANVILHAGATPVFADVDPVSMNIDPQEIEKRIGSRTRAILVVHVGGIPCDMDPIMELAQTHELAVIEDCAHAIETQYKGQYVGTFGYAAAYSFYATKNFTTGEGGMLLTQSEEVAERFRALRHHGIDKGAWERDSQHRLPLYDVKIPGYKCNMTDLQAALGLHQLPRLKEMHDRRKQIDTAYFHTFGGLDTVELAERNPAHHRALHLFRLRLRPETLRIHRDEFVLKARQVGIQLSVNFLPIHLFHYYRNEFGYREGDYPHAEAIGSDVVSLPIYPAMTDAQVEYVCTQLHKILVDGRR